MNACLVCREVPKVKPTSKRVKSGLIRGLCAARCYPRAHANGTLDQVGLPPKPNGTPLREMWSLRPAPDGYVTIKTPDGIIAHHRYVMEQHLGRKLFPGETVHHRNGKRDDNALANLELWFSPQPYGQRVEELIQYVVDFHRPDVVKALQ